MPERLPELITSQQSDEVFADPDIAYFTLDGDDILRTAFSVDAPPVLQGGAGSDVYDVFDETFAYISDLEGSADTLLLSGTGAAFDSLLYGTVDNRHLLVVDELSASIVLIANWQTGDGIEFIQIGDDVRSLAQTATITRELTWDDVDSVDTGSPLSAQETFEDLLAFYDNLDAALRDQAEPLDTALVTYAGTDGPDILETSFLLDDGIAAGAGDDEIHQGFGNNRLDGGGGVDTVFVFTDFFDLDLFRFGNEVLAASSRAGALDGDDLLIDVEIIDNGFETYATGAIPAFSPLQYIASYTDLIAAFGTDDAAGWAHFVSTGYGEERTVTFSARSYIAGYNDLIASFGTDLDGGAGHYISFGAGEGRTDGAFDGNQYLATYADLRSVFGTDTEAAAEHFITFGAGEGRTRDGFNEFEYIAGYDDLTAAFGTNGAAGTEHYIQFGLGEGRSTDLFDGLRYIASNADLIAAFGANANQGALHYIANGQDEGRTVDGFDAVQYLLNYQDLLDAFGDDTDAATRHYIGFGFAEGRTDAVPGASAGALADDTVPPEIAALDDDPLLA